ncbi:hypothetical protein ACIP1G_14850 [Pseudomonas sp. NPDC089392]|uniref:hypothetical protein n=1 Tax=Pseudomonas sp. NPDC089392 TaxID=3364459 RepID=UPI00380BB7C3
MNPAIQATYGKAFCGKLYQRAAGANTSLRITNERQQVDDWVRVGGGQDSPLMEFHFQSTRNNCLLYSIWIIQGRDGKQLGISSNGYLGFYSSAAVKAPWQLEPLELTGEGLLCNLLDDKGRRVSVLASEDRILNVSKGEPCTFLLKPLGQ